MLGHVTLIWHCSRTTKSPHKAPTKSNGPYVCTLYLIPANMNVSQTSWQYLITTFSQQNDIILNNKKEHSLQKLRNKNSLLTNRTTFYLWKGALLRFFEGKIKLAALLHPVPHWWMSTIMRYYILTWSN